MIMTSAKRYLTDRKVLMFRYLMKAVEWDDRGACHITLYGQPCTTAWGAIEQAKKSIRQNHPKWDSVAWVNFSATQTLVIWLNEDNEMCEEIETRR